MLTLSLDTTTRAGSAALARDGVVLEEAPADPAGAAAERLPRDLMALLDRQRVALHAIDLFAVCTGPGSFTGLRIGIAAMQGLAFARGRPLVGVSGMDALASMQDASAWPRVATWVDAWRGEVYAAQYAAQAAALPPTVDAPAALLTEMRAEMSPGQRVLFVGGGADAYRDQIRDVLGAAAGFADPIAPLLAGAVARLATRAAERGETPPPDAIRPLYVRRPDAELARSRARGQGGVRSGSGPAPATVQAG